MAKDKQMVKALAAMRSCVEKNCAQAEGLLADLEVAEGITAFAAEMREKKGQPTLKDIQDLRKKVEALQRKAKKAATSASQEMCALEKCKKQWESLSKAKTAVMLEKLANVHSLLSVFEKLEEKRASQTKR